ncbi:MULTISPECIES: hypothetical protein [Brevibacillus]|nr:MULTISPECIES: hypothetical protein [Brevibacillus]MED1947086.1 hypothetical protein [Brevibacillus formosus]MED2000438.1 hypothetical protein [Brevibacillus formosus]MED2085773.1 hypothetical protein [Brevibacillus formosus]
MDKTNKKKRGVWMIVGGVLAIVGAGYGVVTDKQAEAIQQALEILLTAF